MNEDLYTEKLAWFKQNEKPEAVLLVAGEQQRIKIALKWGNANVRRADQLSELGGASENEVWEWLWNNARYSLSELLEKSGLPFSEVVMARRMRPLIGNRVLYPDGTMNSLVQRYLREQVLKLFDTKVRKSSQRS